MRYFKKVGSTPHRDKVVEVGPCSHPSSSWMRDRGGEKARKGIERRTGEKIRLARRCFRCGRWAVEFYPSAPPAPAAPRATT